MSDYITLPGTLPEAVDHGRVTHRKLDDIENPYGDGTSIEQAKSRQEETLQQLYDQTSGDEEKARQLYWPCGEFCKHSFSAQQPAALSDDHLKMKALADKLLGRTK